jgi:hypothetical protein
MLMKQQHIGLTLRWLERCKMLDLLYYWTLASNWMN